MYVVIDAEQVTKGASYCDSGRKRAALHCAQERIRPCVLPIPVSSKQAHSAKLKAQSAKTGGMHLGIPTKDPLPDKWLADLLAKALLLEYQQPIQHVRRKSKRSGKKARLHSKKTRASRDSVENEQAQYTSNTAGISNALSGDARGTVCNPPLPAAGQPSWRAEDVPVFHLFAQVKKLLGR